MATSATGQLPRLFISHRHKDKSIADALRNWIESTTLREVAVFQSSHPQSGLPVGTSIARSLLDNLWQTQILILIYTHPDQDWSWCMWECGVATDPKSPDTKVVVFECAGVVPALFLDQVNVKVGSKDSLEQFVVQFLTDATFFPRLGHPLAERLHRDDSTLKDAAAKLHAALEAAVPPKFRDASDPWPAWPYMRLSMPAAVKPEQSTSGAKGQGSEAEAERLVDAECIIRFADKVLCKYFGLATIPRDKPFAELPDLFGEAAAPPPRWFLSLKRQVAAATRGKFPTVNWKRPATVESTTGERLCPILCHVTAVPYEGVNYFDIYFLPIVQSRRFLLVLASSAVVALGAFALGYLAGAP
jgi:hypothetical protein